MIRPWTVSSGSSVKGTKQSVHRGCGFHPRNPFLGLGPTKHEPSKPVPSRFQPGRWLPLGCASTMLAPSLPRLRHTPARDVPRTAQHAGKAPAKAGLRPRGRMRHCDSEGSAAGSPQEASTRCSRTMAVACFESNDSQNNQRKRSTALLTGPKHGTMWQLELLLPGLSRFLPFPGPTLNVHHGYHL